MAQASEERNSLSNLWDDILLNCVEFLNSKPAIYQLSKYGSSVGIGRYQLRPVRSDRNI